MNLILGQSKSTTKYLLKRYGKIYKLPYFDQVFYEKVIADDHTQEELNFILRDLEYRRKHASDLNFLDNIPFTLSITGFTVISTFIVSLLVATYNASTNVLSTHFDKEEMSLENLLKSLNPTIFVETGGNLILVYLAMISVLSIFFMSIVTTKRGHLHFFIKLVEGSIRIKSE